MPTYQVKETLTENEAYPRAANSFNLLRSYQQANMPFIVPNLLLRKFKVPITSLPPYLNRLRDPSHSIRKLTIVRQRLIRFRIVRNVNSRQ